MSTPDPTIGQTMTSGVTDAINANLPTVALIGVPILIATVVWRLVKRFAKG